MFDLEKGIKEWKKGFGKYESFEEGLVADMELHVRDAYEAGKAEGLGDEEAFRKAVAQVGTAAAIAGEYRKNRELALDRRTPWRPARFVPPLFWNYFKVAGRKIAKQKGYTFINVAGLMIGMAAFLLIFLYCRFERSYDDFHRNGDRIYRIENVRISAAKNDHSAGCPPGLGPALKKEFPEVADFTRLFNASGDSNIVTRGSSGQKDVDRSDRIMSFYEKRVFFTDPSFLRIFSFPLLNGDAATALEEPDGVVLTEALAKKYFGSENPLQQTISITTQFGRDDYRVTGICRDIPANSHLKFDLLLSYRKLTILWPSLEQQMWSSNGFLTYIILSPKATPGSLERKFPGLIRNYRLESPEVRREFHMQPLRSIHLQSRLRFEAEVNSDKKTVIFLELIGLIILLIAWSNSINLATARSQQRSKEVGIRKTLGAEKRQLAGQFLFESVALNGLAFLLASSLVWVALPFFNRLVERPLSLGQFGIGWIWLASAILAGALLSGSYPAFILSSFRPASALRGSTQGNSKGAVLRKGLVLLQFVLAVVLIVATLILGKQLAFMRNQELGADIERTLVFKIPPLEGTRLAAAVARERLAGLAAVADTTVSMCVPGREYPNAVGGVYRQGGSEKEGQVLFLIDSDERYFGFFKIPLLAGRTFSGGQGADRSVVIINEEAAELLGFENADKAVEQYITGIGGETVQIIGVARDYHHKSLRDKIEPMVFMPLLGENPISFSGNFFLSLKTRGAAIGEVLSAAGKKWRTLFPNQPMDYFFLDEEFNRQYDADQRFARVFGLASLLAIAIACLGLFGLAAFSAERRFREIGIRKVFGASFREITLMLSWEFTRWVLLANLVAWPLAYVAMSGWQQEFAYRAPFGTGVFLLAGSLSLAIALLTVGFQAIRAARANPVDSLRYE